MSDPKLDFTVNEQNCLAELCSVISTMKHFYHIRLDDLNTLDSYQDFAETTIDRLEDMFECFPSINWGELYDKFHRQGKNNV